MFLSSVKKAVSFAKPKETSIFTVIELEDLEYPTLAASIQLPFRVRPNNTVILSGKHVYLTTEQHLHVVDVSIPQRPSYLTSLEFPAKNRQNSCLWRLSRCHKPKKVSSRRHFTTVAPCAAIYHVFAPAKCDQRL